MSEKLISADELKRRLHSFYGNMGAVPYIEYLINFSSAVDAVEVETIKAWLYEIAGNNISTEKERQFSEFCEELISRLDGLRNFARERREENAVD